MKTCLNLIFDFLCQVNTRRWWMLITYLSFALLSTLLPVQAAHIDAKQVQAANLLKIPVAQSFHLKEIVFLDGEDAPMNLELERFEVFAPDVQIVVRNISKVVTRSSPALQRLILKAGLSAILILSWCYRLIQPGLCAVSPNKERSFGFWPAVRRSGEGLI